MDVHSVNSRAGFGNVIMKMVDYLKKTDMNGFIDENLKDYERGRAFDFHVKFIKGHPATMDGDIYCNDVSFKTISSMLSKIMTPSPVLMDTYTSYAHLLEGVGLGMHIRCGSAMNDCKGLSATHGEDFFISNETLKIVHSILNNCKCRVFLASDSKELKRLYKNEFGQKVVTFDTDITLSCDPETCGGVEQNTKSLMDTYLEWYTLSTCPEVFTTCGPGFNELTGKGAGVSTFGFTAAAYGRRTLYIIHSNGFIFKHEQQVV